jgi:hypothetical protein
VIEEHAQASLESLDVDKRMEKEILDRFLA